MYCADLQCPDFLQWGVHGEYRQGITVCPKCGATLVTERPEPGRVGEAEEPVATEFPSLPGPLVTLASFNFRQDAELAVSMLLANGIQAFVAGDDCGSVDPGLGFGTRTRVMVDASQAATASALLEQVAPESPAGGV
jgi:hypothetical protein